MSRHAADFAGIPADMTDENALLRAALAEAQRRIGELERDAESDTVTPLPGARRFRAELERVVGLGERHGSTAALVGIELTGLASLRDRHGDLAADSALVHVARLLSGLIRSTDILARTGDQALGLILDHLDHNSAIDTAERLGRCIAANPLDLGREVVPLEAIVATTGIMPGDKVEEVLARADRNLALARTEARP